MIRFRYLTVGLRESLNLVANSMKRGIFKLATQTIQYYRKPVLYQVLIIVLLTAVITGSLLTGSSVKNSLKQVSAEHLGKTGLVVSSGQRYLGHTLVTRLRDSLKINSSGILIINGFCQNISNQKEALKTQIIAVDNNYFKFQGNDTLKINQGEVLVNRRLAQYLGLKKGDDLALHYNEISDFPAGAPFAPEKGTSSSKVFKVGMILDDAMDGNFSLSISQVTPMNLFINLSEVENDPDISAKINRILIDSRSNFTVSNSQSSLRNL